MNLKKYIPDYRADRIFMLLFVIFLGLSKIAEFNKSGLATIQTFEKISLAFFLLWWLTMEAIISEKNKTIEKLSKNNF